MDKIKPFANTVYSKKGIQWFTEAKCYYQYRQIVDLAFKNE